MYYFCDVEYVNKSNEIVNEKIAAIASDPLELLEQLDEIFETEVCLTIEKNTESKNDFKEYLNERLKEMGLTLKEYTYI